MERAPEDLNCSWSDRDASGNVVIFSSITTTATSADNFNSICFSDTADNSNRSNTYSHNVTQSQTQDINSFYFYEVRYLWFL
jgi:hypothetical protein